jgi:hypothetical protein
MRQLLSKFWKSAFCCDAADVLLKVIPLVNPLIVFFVDPLNISRCAALMASMEHLDTDFILLVEINILVPKISFPGDCGESRR